MTDLQFADLYNLIFLGSVVLAFGLGAIKGGQP